MLSFPSELKRGNFPDKNNVRFHQNAVYARFSTIDIDIGTVGSGNTRQGHELAEREDPKETSMPRTIARILSP